MYAPAQAGWSVSQYTLTVLHMLRISHPPFNEGQLNADSMEIRTYIRDMKVASQPWYWLWLLKEKKKENTVGFAVPDFVFSVDLFELYFQGRFLCVSVKTVTWALDVIGYGDQ